MSFRLNCLIIGLIMFTIYVTKSEETDIKWIKSGHTGNTQIHYFYNDNNYVVTSGSEKTIKITNMKNDSIIFKASLNDIIINARVTDDDTKIIVLTSISDRLLPSVLIYDINTGEKLDSVYIKNVYAFAQVDLSNDSKLVSYIDKYDKVRLSDIETGEYLAMFDSLSILDTYSFEFSPNNEHIGIVYDKAVKIYNYKTMQLFKEINITSKILSKIAFNNDGSKMIVYDPDGNVTIINSKTGELIDTKKFPEKSIRQVLFTNDTSN